MSDPLDRRRTTRLVARQVSELLFARGDRWHPVVPQDGLGGIIVAVVLSASLAHQPYRDPVSKCWIGFEDAKDLGRPVTGTAIAHSMGLPHTSVRRHATELVEAGLLIRNTAGFSVSPDLLTSGRTAQVAAGNAADLIRRLSALAEAGYDPAARALDAGIAELPPGVIERMLLAFGLRAMETFTELYRDMTAGTIVAAIIVANVGHITSDPQLARLYAGEDMLPPDALRRPIALRALSRVIDMPFETVRRRVAALVAEGVVAWKEDGVYVPTHVLLSERQLENNRRINAHFEQMVAALASLATDFMDRADALPYLNGAISRNLAR